jgi:hypothetical protein
MIARALVACLLLGFISAAIAGEGPYGKLPDDFKLVKDEDKKDMKSVPPPAGAVVLFDGKSLDNWIHRNGKDPAKFKLVEGGIMQSTRGGGDIITKEKFDGKFTLHVEFRVPYAPNSKGQGRGNSGVYLQGRYEVQILDSYGIEKIAMNDCGAIYGVAIASKNMCKAPTVWQSYDIEFESPKCVDGKKTAPGVMTVYHNGVKIHDKVKITSDNTTSGAGGDVCTPGPILLQDHGDPVQFRNVWLVPIKE